MADRADQSRRPSATSWPPDLVKRHGIIRDELNSGRPDAEITAKRLVDALMADCAPTVLALVRRQCHRINRIDLVDDAMQNASVDVLRVLSESAARDNVLTYLRAVILNAVSRCVTAQGGLFPTAAQRRRASIDQASGLFLAEHQRYPSEDELLAAQHALMASRADAKNQAALASRGEIRAYLYGEEPFTEEGHDEVTSDRVARAPFATDSRLLDHTDHVEDDLALDPLDLPRLVALTADACTGLHPKIDGRAFAVTVLTDTMRGTANEARWAREFRLTRSVVRTAVFKVWQAAETVARSDLGIATLRVDPDT